MSQTPDQIDRIALRREATEMLIRAGHYDGIGPAAMAAECDPRFVVGPHTEVMNRELARLLITPGGSTMINTPPRIGKSVLSSQWMPWWWLTMLPQDRIVLAAYAERLAMRHALAARNLAAGYAAQYGLELSRTQAAKSDWSLTTGGGMIARGVGGGLTGEDMHCLVGETGIITREGTRSIASIVDGRDLPEVLSYNHKTCRPEWRQVIATRRIENRPVVRVRTASGRVVECTDNHRFYTARGYVTAANLIVGDRLTEACPPVVRAMRNLDHAGTIMPLGTPQRTGDSVVSVQPVRGSSVPVYDLQVEGNSNFFADEILVHNCGIIDDPVKDRAAAESVTIRDGVWDWYSAAFLSRQEPHTRRLVVMTRWHADDLAGRILDSEGRVEEGGVWRVVHLPAIALPENPEKGLYGDPLGRAPGEPLSHPKIAVHDVKAAKEHWERARLQSTARDWNALYQGVPYDAEGALLTDEQVRTATAPAPDGFKRIVVGVDPAGGGRDTVGIVVVGLDAQRHAWFLDDRTERMSAADWPRLVCEVASEHAATQIVVEKNFGGDMGKQLIAQAWESLSRDGRVSGMCPLVVEVSARKSKVLRAEPVAQAILTGRVWFARNAGLKQLAMEFTMWEPGSTWSPGALDAGVHAVTEVLPASPRGSEVHNPVRRRRSESGGRGLVGRRR